ncbi:MAG: hypothetical protein RR703_02000 [Bacilli bacterium]
MEKENIIKNEKLINDLKKLKETLQNEFKNEINNDSSQKKIDGVVKVKTLTGTGTSKPDQAAFVDILILSSITAAFSLLSFITILLYAI